MTQKSSLKLTNSIRHTIILGLAAGLGTVLLLGQDSLLFLSGSVVTQDGSPPPGVVRIELICLGAAPQDAYTDPAGNFQFRFDSMGRFAPSFMAPAEQSGGAHATSPAVDTLKMCDLSVAVPGFQPMRLHLNMLEGRGIYDVGAIALERITRQRLTTGSASSLGVPRKAMVAREKGRQALVAGNLKQAESALAAATSLYPKYGAAWIDLGVVHLQRGDLESAASAFRWALEADPKIVPAYLGLTGISLQEGKWQEAAEWSSRAMALYPFGLPRAYYLNAVANFQLGRVDAAQRSAEAARSQEDEPPPEVDQLLAAIHAQRGDYDAAARLLRNCLKRAGSPLAELARRQLAEVEAQAGSARD